MEHTNRSIRRPLVVTLAALMGLVGLGGCLPKAKRSKSLKQLVQEMQVACRAHKRDAHYRSRIVAIDILVLKSKNARARRETRGLTRYCRERTAAPLAAAPKVATTPPATPPGKAPLATTPPTTTPPAKTPPAKTPPAKTPPAKTPPAKTPPAKTPPAKTPPATTPPATTPPATTPPATTPPAPLPKIRATGATLAAIVKADRVCAPLRRDRRFRSAPATPIREMMGRIDAYVRAQLEAKAKRIAEKLAARCSREKERRDELAPLVRSVEQDRRRIRPAAYALFHTLVARGQYSAAIICGEGLIRGRPDRCSSAAAASPDDGDETEPTIDDSKLSADDDADDDGRDADVDLRDIGYPLNVALYPFESAVLRSQAGVSFYVSQLSDLPGGTRRSHTLALHGQYAVADRLQLSIMVPVLASLNSQTTGGYLIPQIALPVNGQRSLKEQENFGNIELGVKVKLAGSSTGFYSLAGYFTGLIPSTSRKTCDTRCSDDQSLRTREFSMMRTGLAVNVNLLEQLTVGAGIGWIFQVLENLNLHVDQTFDFFGALRLHRLVALQVGLQFSLPYVTSFEVDGVEQGEVERKVRAGLMAGVQVFPIQQLSVDIGARIALNDGGRVYTDTGRAAFITSVGYLF